MSLEHALIGEISRLKGQLGGMEREVDQHRQTMENAKAMLETAEERLVNQRALISYLEMSLEEATDTFTGWRVGDRFCWRKFVADKGTITGVDKDRVYLRTDAGGVLTMSVEQFEERAARL